MLSERLSIVAADTMKPKRSGWLKAKHIGRPARISCAVVGVAEISGPDFGEAKGLEVGLKNCRL
jgi:hypothetical protein